MLACSASSLQSRRSFCFAAAVRCTTKLWEDQKRLAAEAAQATATRSRNVVEFVEPPPALVAELLGADCFAADGMHPNDNGYRLWADIIAARLLA